MQSQWAWLQQLLSGLNRHLDNANKYHQVTNQYGNISIRLAILKYCNIPYIRWTCSSIFLSVFISYYITFIPRFFLKIFLTHLFINKMSVFHNLGVVICTFPSRIWMCYIRLVVLNASFAFTSTQTLHHITQLIT